MNTAREIASTQIQGKFLWRLRGFPHKLFTGFQEGVNFLQVQSAFVEMNFIHLSLEKPGTLNATNV